MKKILLIAAVAVFGFTSANAQDFNLGAKGGVNFSNVGGDETDDADALTSFHIGLVGEIMLTDKFAFQPEILYSIQGTSSENSETFAGVTNTEKYERRLDYVTVPLMAKYYILEGLNVELGPQVGFLVKAEDEIEYSGDDQSLSGTTDIKDAISGVDYGLSFGAGYKLEMGLFFNARYYLGLSNIYKDAEDMPSDLDFGDIKNQNRVFQVSVGWMF